MNELVSSLGLALPVKRFFNFPQQEGNNQDTRHKSGHEKPSEVQLSRVDLRQREAGDAELEELVALAHRVPTAAREAAFQRRNRAEEGGAEGQPHLAAATDGDGVVAVRGERQASGDGTRAPDER